MQPDVLRLTKRPAAYWFEDGLGEMVVGGLFIIASAFFIIEGAALPGTLLRKVAGYGGLTVMILGSWLMRPILGWLKARLTYNRGGYVSFRKPLPRRRAVALLLVFIIAGATVWLIGQLTVEKLSWLPLFEGVVVGGFMFYQGFQVRMRRFYLLSVFVFVLGASLSFAGVQDLIGMGSFFAGTGLLLVLSGAWTYRWFLRNVPIVEGEADGEA